MPQSSLSRILAVAPGVIIHELGHVLLCRLSRVPVRKTVLFRVGSPAGFVTHDTPRLLRQHLAISMGPLAVSTTLAIGLLVLAARILVARPQPWWPVVVAVAVWTGWSIALEAWPSRTDAMALRGSAASQLWALNPSASLALWAAWLLLALHASRRFGGHWLYAVSLAAAAVRVAEL